MTVTIKGLKFFKSHGRSYAYGVDFLGDTYKIVGGVFGAMAIRCDDSGMPVKDGVLLARTFSSLIDAIEECGLVAA